MWLFHSRQTGAESPPSVQHRRWHGRGMAGKVAGTSAGDRRGTRATVAGPAPGNEGSRCCTPGDRCGAFDTGGAPKEPGGSEILDLRGQDPPADQAGRTCARAPRAGGARGLSLRVWHALPCGTPGVRSRRAVADADCSTQTAEACRRSSDGDRVTCGVGGRCRRRLCEPDPGWPRSDRSSELRVALAREGVGVGIHGRAHVPRYQPGTADACQPEDRGAL